MATYESTRLRQKPPTLRELGIIIVLLTLLTVAMTYPLAFQITDSYASLDPADPPFTIWEMTWEAHQIILHPSRLFDANIFFPVKNALAYSTLNLIDALLALPILYASNNPILAYNAIYLFAFALLPFGVYLLLRQLQLGPLASFIGALVAGFASFRFLHLSHLEILASGWLPLFLMYLHRWSATRRWRDWLLSIAFFVLQSLNTWYYAFFLSIAAGAFAACAVPARGWRRPQTWPNALAVVGVPLIGWFVMMPLLLPYLPLQSGFNQVRTIETAVSYSPDLINYTKRLDFAPARTTTTPRAICCEANYFPGWTTLALCVAGVLALLRDRSGKAIHGHFYLLLALIAFALSFGPIIHINGQESLPGPDRLLRDLLPGYNLLRAPGRWNAVLTLALAILAGVGGDRLLALFPRGQLWMAAIICGLVLAEDLMLPVPLDRLPIPPHIPSVYQWLVQEGSNSPILELPIDDRLHNRYYMYYSTFHWRPLLNGDSDYAPPWWQALVKASADFPSPSFLLQATRLGARYVVFHAALYSSAQRTEMAGLLHLAQAQGQLRAVQSFGDDIVYELKP